MQNELKLLKQEKEEMEDQQEQAEALQLTQSKQVLYSTETGTGPQDENIATYRHQYPFNSFICPFNNEMMADPVAVLCGHSFERKAIQDYFNRGGKNCPTCREELPSLELTPNVNLRRSIEEWKQREMDLRLQDVVCAINSIDRSIQSKALEDLQLLMEMPQYAVKVAAEELLPKLVDFLKDNRVNTIATLRCLYFLAKLSDRHKELIVEAGAIRRIVKQIYRGKQVADAMAVLLELSHNGIIREKIGDTKDCIPLLVFLLDNNDPDVSQKAKNLLQNLSSNASFVVKMAEAGYFEPFVARFNQGPEVSRASMADDFLKMELKERSMEDLKNKKFIHNLIQMLSSNSSSYKLVCLKCIKKLVTYPMMAKLLLSDSATIPALLGNISFISLDPHLKQEACVILVQLIGACQDPHFELHQGLQELQSEHNISLFLQLVVNSNPQIRNHFLHLLVELGHKSDIARDLIRSKTNEVAHLFSSLDDNKPLGRIWTLKLIHCISDGHPDGVPLPPSRWRGTAINTLVAILNHSLDVEERSLAAGIISQLPKHDTNVDEILCKSEVLKAIREVICSTQEEHKGTRLPVNVDGSLLENVLTALLRFTEPTKPELQRQVGTFDLYPSLVRILSSGSSLAKKQAATALAQLSQSTSLLVSDANIRKQAKDSMPLLCRNFFPVMTWCCSTTSLNENMCSVHGAACSPRDTFCLVKADAVKPLVRTLSETETGVAEAALVALETLVKDHSSPSHGTAAIVDNQGVEAILQLLEKGTSPAKLKALNLFHEILKHTQIKDPLFERSERILIQLLHEDALKKKVALVLKQMSIIPEQSSYF